LIADRASVNVAKIEIETRVPPPLANNLFIDQIGHVVDGTAKASWTNHGAIRATETPLGNVIPSHMIQTLSKRRLHMIAIQRSLNLLDRLLSSRIGPVHNVGWQVNNRQTVGDSFSHFRTDFHNKSVFQFGHCQIKSRLATRTGSHRCAETRRGG
jgi:hypothetical protein